MGKERAMSAPIHLDHLIIARILARRPARKMTLMIALRAKCGHARVVDRGANIRICNWVVVMCPF